MHLDQFHAIGGLVVCRGDQCLGRFVDRPIVWGQRLVLGTANDVETGELFDTLDTTIDDLPAAEQTLITLVDLDNQPLDTEVSCQVE